MGIMFVYDVINEVFFKNVMKWMSKIVENVNRNVDKILLVSKCDFEEKCKII